MRPNVRTTDTGITHERTPYGLGARQWTRCGLRYLQDGQYALVRDGRPIAHETKADVDCMACVAIAIVETEHDDLDKIIPLGGWA